MFQQEQEEQYEARAAALSSNFFWLSVFQILTVIASAGYSVWNLKKYFVKKAIF